MENETKCKTKTNGLALFAFAICFWLFSIFLFSTLLAFALFDSVFFSVIQFNIRTCWLALLDSLFLFFAYFTLFHSSGIAFVNSPFWIRFFEYPLLDSPIDFRSVHTVSGCWERGCLIPHAIVVHTVVVICMRSWNVELFLTITFFYRSFWFSPILHTFWFHTFGVTLWNSRFGLRSFELAPLNSLLWIQPFLFSLFLAFAYLQRFWFRPFEFALLNSFFWFRPFCFRSLPA